MSRSSAAAVSLILREEGAVGHPYWPGSLSGVTLDFGYDLGEHALLAFHHDWAALPDPGREALEATLGLRGQGARALLEAQGLGTIVIPRPLAEAVFAEDSLPEVEQEVLLAMPGAEQLPADAFGAIASCIYNRGPNMDGDRRVELRAIRTAAAAFAATGLASTRVACLQAIARQLDVMGDRLWPGPDSWNTILRNRRHAEAALVRQAATHLATGEAV